MNIDHSIHRMAIREAESLGLVQVLVAKKRQELELRLQRQKVIDAAAASNAGIDRALEDMREQSELLAREPDPENDTGVLVDKTA